MTEGFLIFDMDGVLVDVSESYRATIIQTVADYTGQQVGPDLIQDYKNRGGWNDDWELSHRIVADLGVNIEFDEIVRHFQPALSGRKRRGRPDPARALDRPPRRPRPPLRSLSTGPLTPAAASTR